MTMDSRTTSINVSIPASPQSPDLHHRPPYTTSMTNQSPLSSFTQQTGPIPNATAHLIPSQNQESEALPTLLGMPLKYVSLITLAVQNATLTIIMHHSRVSTPPSRAYSAASAVLLNELLKGSISLAIAVSRIDKPHSLPIRKPSAHLTNGSLSPPASPVSASFAFGKWMYRFRRVGRDVFSDDCWKLAIPAVLYVVQNNLQYVAAANLDIATFTVTYQMKILTTAAFSVMLLRKKLGSTKWLALFFLAIGVGIVQLQAGARIAAHTPSRDMFSAIMSQNGTLSLSDHESDLMPVPEDPAVHSMQPLKGFFAVTAACFTSGLAGVYFEMVLKGSKADLWIRNVQLSLFSLLPALIAIILSHPDDSAGWFWDLFRNFGLWAWATVAVQVFGGLVTAVVIKYSDNILKGFATSLSIIISFLASVALFDFKITPAFVFGATIVVLATFLYNRPSGKSVPSMINADVRVPFPGSPIGDGPILGHFTGKKRFSIAKTNARSITPSIGLAPLRSETHTPLSYDHVDAQYRSFTQPFYTNSPTPSPPPSRPPTRPPSTSRPTVNSLDTLNLGRDVTPQ